MEINDNNLMYTLSTDRGSNYLVKVHPIMIYSFIPSKEQIEWRMLDVGLLDGRGTGENISGLVKKSITGTHEESVENATSLNPAKTVSILSCNL